MTPMHCETCARYTTRVLPTGHGRSNEHTPWCLSHDRRTRPREYCERYRSHQAAQASAAPAVTSTADLDQALRALLRNLATHQPEAV